MALVPFGIFAICEIIFFGSSTLVHRCQIEFKQADYWTLFLIAPLSEELFFRGLLLHALLTRYSKSWAIVISSILFMLAHGIWAFGPLSLGLIAGWMALKFRSIVPGIIFHTISNAYMPALCKWFPGSYDFISKLPILVK
ncbi:MAG: CPBP family intramembrane metalloprotease [Bdellovibrionales bacterium]|nr:CPBP family intramembrane metalloprotease [Bdellovibrionales bacterium]